VRRLLAVSALLLFVLGAAAASSPEPRPRIRDLGRRGVLGLARAGSFLSNGSGDFVIAFSTRNRIPYEPRERTRAVEDLHDDAMSPLFLAVVEAVEEAVYNSLLRATDVSGHAGSRGEAIPIDRLRELLRDSMRP
jgi:D-aminopeptidase